MIFNIEIVDSICILKLNRKKFIFLEIGFFIKRYFDDDKINK